MKTLKRSSTNRKVSECLVTTTLPIENYKEDLRVYVVTCCCVLNGIWRSNTLSENTCRQARRLQLYPNYQLLRSSPVSLIEFIVSTVFSFRY